MTFTISLSTKSPSGKGWDTVIKSQDFETKEGLRDYVLNLLNTQHALSSDGLTVLKACLAFTRHRITYSLSQEPEIFHTIDASSNSKSLLQKDELIQAKATTKKIHKIVSNVLEPSEQAELLGFKEANESTDLILRAFLNSADFRIIKIGPNISGTEITYKTCSLESFSDDEGSIFSEEEDTVLVDARALQG
jgi:hypothetical protein